MHSELDRNFLQQLGGVENNSFVKIIDPYPDDDGNINETITINHSSYYDQNNFISTLKKNKNQFSIFSTNIQSIRAKIDELKIFMETLKQSHIELSAICIQESWLTEGEDTFQIELDGYQCIPQGRSCTSKGGLIIYLNNKFKYDEKMKLINYSKWEGQVIQINKGDCLKKPIIIGNIYRPPNELVDSYTEFINELSPILTNLESSNSEVILAGDFNIDLLKINDKPKISEYFDTMTNHSFFPKITLPTRLSIKHGTLIDNFFCKLSEHTLDTTSGILIKKFSDHQPYFTLIDNLMTNNPTTKFITVTKQDVESKRKFLEELQNSAEIKNLDINPNLDPNINYNILHNLIQAAKELHMPSKKVKFKKYKHKKTKWITRGIINSIQFRDNLYKVHKMTDPDSLDYTIQDENLKIFRCILRKTIRDAKKLYYDRLFRKFKSDIKGIWKTINDILSKSKKKRSFPSFFKDEENNIITDKVQIANKFNTFFTTIGPNLARKITAPRNKTFQNYLTKTCDNIFKFQDITEITVNNIIDNLAPKISFGFDGLSTKLIKSIKPVIVRPITIIINQMLKTGTFPDKLKIAKINPIYKKEDETLFTNYRPISLLPAISKVFEKVMSQQIYKFFHDKKLFYCAQYGFRSEHSTEFAALEFVDRVIVDMDQMETPIGIFLDLSKAFDTLDHEILLHKLKFYGFDKNALKLMESYLTDRKQYVQMEDTISEYSNVSTGVPQGSILGPLLFIIYINDIAQASNLFDFIIYADDTSLTTTLEIIYKKDNNSSIQNIINTELTNINDWLKVNKLSLNIKKTKYMIFHMPKKKVNTIELKIEDTIIERVSDFNFLGITINEHLNWKSHIDNISNKISRNIGIVNKLKHFLPLNTKILIYNSLIASHINYALLAWGFACDRIVKLQKKAVRVISVSKYNAHTDPIFKRLKLLKVTDILKLQELKFFYKFKKGQLPHYLQNLPIKYNSETHQHYTRIQDNIHVNRTAHQYAKKCIRYDLPVVINSTPRQILTKIEPHSLRGFTGYIKQHFLNSYQVNCTIPGCYICARN
jgi:hypothetical protein